MNLQVGIGDEMVDDCERDKMVGGETDYMILSHLPSHLSSSTR